MSWDTGYHDVSPDIRSWDTNCDITPPSGRTSTLDNPVWDCDQSSVALVLLTNPLDGVRSPQSPRRLMLSFRVMVVVIFESSDLILELFADLHRRAVTSDFGGEGYIADVGEGVVHYA